jgi:hypothetical protein
LDTGSVFKCSQTRLELDSVGDTDFGGLGVGTGFGIGKSVYTDREGSFGGDHTGHLSLELLWCLSN